MQGVQPSLRPDVDNHQVHVASHTKFAKTEKFRSLDPSLQNLWMQHLLSQKQVMVVQMQNLQMMQGGGATPPNPKSAEPQRPGVNPGSQTGGLNA